MRSPGSSTAAASTRRSPPSSSAHAAASSRSVARIGGEEFAILVPDTDADGAYVLAERLRCQVQVGFGDRLQPITMSFGIAALPGDGAGAGELLRAADNALYAAKRLGRNQTVRYARTVPAVADANRRAR